MILPEWRERFDGIMSLKDSMLMMLKPEENMFKRVQFFRFGESVGAHVVNTLAIYVMDHIKFNFYSIIGILYSRTKVNIDRKVWYLFTV